MEKLAFIGAGSMAEAVISGVVETEFLPKEMVCVTNKENQTRLDEMRSRYGVNCLTNKAEAVKDADAIIIATKPYDVEAALDNIKTYVSADQLIISVVAGLSTAYITDKLAINVPVIRAMPNTSATIGLSATAITKGQFASDADLEVASHLFSAIGTVSVVEEEQMHVVTGISGSGPAYIYYLVEAMENAAVSEGLDRATAQALITQTIIGAGNMLDQRTESAALLRKNVTSPNGTTAAGLDTLASYHFQEAVEACVKSAANRSRELGKTNV